MLLTAGARADRSTIAGRSDWSLTGRGGALLDLGEVTLRAAAYSGLRLPTLNELYRPFVVFPVTTEANDALRPEIVRGHRSRRQLEAGCSARTSASLYSPTSCATRSPTSRYRPRSAAATMSMRSGCMGSRPTPPRNWARSTSCGIAGVERFARAGRWSARRQAPRPDRALQRQRDARLVQCHRPGSRRRFAMSARNMKTTSTATGCLRRRRSACSQATPCRPASDLQFRAENLFDERVVTRDQGGSIDLGQPRTFWIGLKLDGAARLSGARSAAKPDPMKIAFIGGGPAGLYFAISMKLRDPSHDVHVFERNRDGVTFGWGVVFSDQTVENLTANDPVSAQIIADEFAHWDDIDVHIHGETVRSSGHGFIGIGRKRLLEILARPRPRARRRLHFEHECDPDHPSLARLRPGHRRRRHQQPLPRRLRRQLRRRRRRRAPTSSSGSARRRCSTPSPSPSRRPRHGWIWAHAYRFAPDCSTFIVECSEATWRGLGFDRMDQAEAIALCEQIFAKYLDGHR